MKNIVRVDPNLKVQKISDIINLPVIIRVNEFDNESLKDFDLKFNEALLTKQPVIPIVIDSFGGGVYALLGMISMIESSPVPVATIVSSKAMSCGAMLFCFGTEGYRIISKNAYLMFHDISSFMFGKLEELKICVDHVKKLNEYVFSKASLHIGKDEDYLINLIEKNKHADLYMSADESLKHNIANHIGLPRFDIDIKVNIEFNIK